ncbi:MAG: hypothetical protein WC365_01380 [Candidatus Babeliales bacterium]|jgi:hypothetical protein
MKLKGIFTKATPKQQLPFFLRLVEASTYKNSVAVEAVDAHGKRIALICRISTEMGVEMYDDVPKELGFPMDAGESTSVLVQSETTC